MNCHALLTLKFDVETGSPYVAQVGLKLLGSSDPLNLFSQSVGITGAHATVPGSCYLFYFIDEETDTRQGKALYQEPLCQEPPQGLGPSQPLSGLCLCFVSCGGWYNEQDLTPTDTNCGRPGKGQECLSGAGYSSRLFKISTVSVELNPLNGSTDGVSLYHSDWSAMARSQAYYNVCPPDSSNSPASASRAFSAQKSSPDSKPFPYRPFPSFMVNPREVTAKVDFEEEKCKRQMEGKGKRKQYATTQRTVGLERCEARKQTGSFDNIPTAQAAAGFGASCNRSRECSSPICWGKQSREPSCQAGLTGRHDHTSAERNRAQADQVLIMFY
ncbi:hypothetical protein AAY473_011800 [Plecturocebus cupreus]